MATPPRGRKMAPERPFPILIETGKSYSKTGLFRRFSGGFLGSFTDGFPAVFPASSTAVFSAFLPVVFRRFDGYTGPVDIRLLPSVPSSVLRLSGLA